MSVSRTGDSRFIAQPRGPWLAVPASRLFEGVVWLIVAMIAFYNLSSLNPEKDKVGLDQFVLLKLMLTGLAGLIGIYGALAIPRVVHLLTTRPGIWLSGIACFFTVSSFFSITPFVSLASSISLWCILLFATTAIVVTGPLRVVKATVAGIVAFVLASWLAWLALPDLGVFAEPVSEGRFVTRMSGIAHPNVLGQYSAMAAGLLLIFYVRGEIKSKLVFAVVALCLAALVLSISRASILALVFATGLVYRDRIWRIAGPLPLLILATIATGSLLVISTRVDLETVLDERLFSQVAKSGEAEELTSMTGRTDIWQYALARVQEQPWTGPGPATSKEILKDYSSYTHNLWLNVAFCGGIFGFLCILGLTFGRVIEAFGKPHRIADFIIVFLLVNGLVENVVFSFIPAAPTILLVTASLWRGNQMISEREAMTP